MYESHFGLSGSPFRLNPDPAFYFGSSGHTNAMSYLRFGVDQGEGFVVVTGDVGAGKTTLVRTLMAGIDDDEVVAAHVANTQLGPGELLQAIVTSFGLPTRSSSKAELLADLEAFLGEVVAHGRRALLIVDEAQNLSIEAIEELRMLSNFQLGHHALLQSFLVGQPELRKHMQSRSMEQFRQRVIASCHLGPLTAEETRGYIEHRLRRVGWHDRPLIDDEAFRAVHEWTGGIPRRINLLFNRVLLAAYGARASRIGRVLVEETASDATRETSEAAALPEAAPPSPAAAAAGERRTPAGAELLPGCEDIQFIERAPKAIRSLSAPLLCIADSPTGLLHAAALARATAAMPGMPAVVVLNPGLARALESEALAPGLAGSLSVEVHLGVPNGPPTERIAAVTLRLGQVLDELMPCAVITAGQSDDVLSCATLAVKRGLPLGRLGAGRRLDDQPLGRDLNAVLIDRMSAVLYTPLLKTHYTLYREGNAADRMVCIGNLLTDELKRTIAGLPPVPEILKLIGLTAEQMRRALRGFVVVSAQVEPGDIEAADLTPVAQVVADLGQETLVIWTMNEATAAAVRGSKADALLQNAGVVRASVAGYAAQLGLMRGATCVIAGPGWRLIDEADCLDIPGIVLHPDGNVPVAAASGVVARIPCDSLACVRALHEVLERGRAEDEQIDGAGGVAAGRLVDHLRRWLPAPAARAADRSLDTDLSSV